MRPMIKVRDYHLLHPALSEDNTLEDLLYRGIEPQRESTYLDRGDALKKYRKTVRRMNRISKYGFLSATAVLEPFFREQDSYDPWRFGTIFSTSFASYDNVISHLHKLYAKGIEGISPIEFTYAVGNAVISGITMTYQLKGPSGSFPDSEVLPVIRHYFNEGSCDYMLWGIYNTLIPEIASYYDHLFRTVYGDASTEPAEGIALKRAETENYTSILLEDTEVGEGVFLSDIASLQKEKISDAKGDPMDSELQMRVFKREDIHALLNALIERGVDLEDIDGVISAACGHPSYDYVEKDVLEAYFPNAAKVYPHALLSYGASGSFSINSLVAFEILKKGSFPEEISRGVREDRPKKILCLGVNKLGNLTGGVWIWKRD